LRLKLFLSAFIIDQLTKWGSIFLPHELQLPLGLGILKLQSRGYLFGLFQFIHYNRLLLVLVVLLFLFIIQLFFRFYWQQFRRNCLSYSSFALILGGVIGNFVDGIIFGYVRDFIRIPFFHSTNLADVFILIGLIILSIEFLANRNFRSLLFKLKPWRTEVKILSPIIRIPIQDWNRLFRKK